MVNSFDQFAELVHDQFVRMSEHELFVVNMSGDSLWNEYLAAFPEGTNPIFRERTDHDCSCCKQFIRNIANVVTIRDGEIISIWDIDDLPFPYDKVAEKMSELVHSYPIQSVFRTKEGGYGTKCSIEHLGDGQTHRWYHFHAKIDSKHQSLNADRQRGEINTTVSVMYRGLMEITAEALETVLELIHNGNLYRGEEHLSAVRNFKSLHKTFHTLDNSRAQHTFVWGFHNDRAARFRNTVIGTLALDLSECVDLETAVRSFEQKVAPTNYKRPTALITQGMVKNAMATIRDLDLESALERRFAKISDISVNNVLWVDNAVQGQMRDGLEDMLMDAASTKTSADAAKRAQDIGISEFMERVVPQAKSMEVFVKNSMQNAFMSLTAPVHEDSGRLFKWHNDFGWSYDGNITDSIKERVKRAGGNTTAPFRVSLGWFNYDDLDIHVIEPDGNYIYFQNMNGKLDVDMNAGSGHSREAVENVSWTRPKNGKYTVKVHQYAQRETSDVGFVIEVENNGSVQQFSYPKAVKDRTKVTVGTITVHNGEIIKTDFNSEMIGGGISQEKWGINTEQFVKVSTLMYSPNHWDDNQVGNKHWFFILDGCRNPEPTRGIYNEFLASNLEEHRKVFEILGDKTKCQPTDDQLSGVGFSSTRGDNVLVSVTGEGFQKVYNISFKE